MLDLRMVTDRLDEVRNRLGTRGEVAGLDRVAELGARRRTLIQDGATRRA